MTICTKYLYLFLRLTPIDKQYRLYLILICYPMQQHRLFTAHYPATVVVLLTSLALTAPPEFQQVPHQHLQYVLFL